MLLKIFETIFIGVLFLNILIVIAAFIFGFVLLKRSKKNQIYFNFGMANLFLGLWAADIILLFSFPTLGVIFGNLSWFLGIWILHYFLIFTYYFPTPLKTKIYFNKTVLYFLTLLLSISILFQVFIPWMFIQFFLIFIFKLIL
jgi:preprotein translocase subunit SecG